MPANFPTINNQSIIQKITFKHTSAVAVLESPYSYTQTTQDFGGRKYEAVVTIRPLTHSEAVTFETFLQNLNGTGTFYLTNPLGGTQRTYRLSDPDYEYDIDTNGLYSFSFACTEVIT
jgi:hypothetical protein